MYNSGAHPFDFITFAYYKNKIAENYAGPQYNLSYVPAVFWDGGNIVTVGNISQYTSNINSCKTRAVNDIDTEIIVKWVGDATLEITVAVTNNEAGTYDGYLRVFIVELISSMGWVDYAGIPYTHPLLDLPFNENIVLNSGETWESTVTWVGADHNSGYGQTFGSITPGNIKVIAGVYENVGHQAYSYPQGSAYPFTAYYLDDSVSARPEFLSVDNEEIPEAGGTVNLYLCGGKSIKRRPYLLVGGVTGTSPGTTLPGGLVLPVNWDVFSDIVMSLLNSPVFADFYGMLDNEGFAAAQINAPTLTPTAVGTVMYYAWCTGKPFDFVSTPVEVTIVP